MKVVRPRVQVIGHTTYFPPTDEEGGMILAPAEDKPRSGEAIAEFAGRGCYQAWHRPNPATASNEGYLANILRQGHFSVLEHASVTFYITGVSRAFTHELIRHRHLSFSQLSQRFVNEANANIVVPPGIRTLSDEQLAEIGKCYGYEFDSSERVKSLSDQAQEDYAILAKELQERAGLTRKQAREAARSVLPNATETKITVTGNYRAWIEFLLKRDSPSADAEIREVARIIRRLLSDWAPHVFGHDAERIWRGEEESDDVLDAVV